MSRKKGRSKGNSLSARIEQAKKAILRGEMVPYFTSDPRSVQVDEFDEIDEMDKSDFDLAGIFSYPSSRRPKSGLIAEWREELEELLECYPQEATRQFAKKQNNFLFNILGIYSDGFIHGETSDGHQHLKIFINLYSDEPIGCSCTASNGVYVCEHNYNFVRYLINQLKWDSSQLSVAICNEDFETEYPDMSVFKANSEEMYRKLLHSVLPTGISFNNDEAIGLPEFKEEIPQRIAWNFTERYGDLEVTPLLQNAKKRGNGWTKGRRVALSNLEQQSHALSAVDQRIAELIKIDSNSIYRGFDFILDPFEAMELLVDQQNVYFDGDLVEVAHLEFGLKIAEVDGEYGIKAQGIGPHAKIYLSEKTLVAVDIEKSSIQVCSFEPVVMELIHKVLKLPLMPPTMLGELCERAKVIQQVVPVEIPEEYRGKMVRNACHPVLLLRSRSGGQLDYGIRVRDSRGKLHLPARGQMMELIDQNGEQVQLVRSRIEETELKESVMQQLGLSDVECNGTIADFGRVLNVIESLEEFDKIEFQSSEGSSTSKTKSKKKKNQGQSESNTVETKAKADGATTDASGADSKSNRNRIEVLWDEKSEPPVRVLGSVTPSNVSVGISRKRDWFQLSGECELTGGSMSLADMLAGLQSADANSVRGDFVKIGNKGWAKISGKLRQQFEKLRDAVNQERSHFKFDATSAPAIRELMEGSFELKATKSWNDCLKRLEQAERLDPKIPDGLNAELRDYQKEGYCWLRRLAEWGVGGVLADDMGLGKTLQTLGVLLDRASEGPALVIAPTSVGFNWIREAEKFTSDLQAHLYRDTNRREFLQQVGPGSLVVCSYGLALRDQEQLADVEWSTLVLDEAQAIKNSRSKTSAAIAKIPADWKVALTGTPVENHLGELWSLFHVISPGVLGGWEQFRRRFASPIERDGDEQRRLALRDRLEPFVLRRTKEQVLKDLPARTEMNLWVELSAAERKLYDEVRLSAVGELDEIAGLPDSQDQRFRILALLTRLRQLACSPRLVHDDWKERSAKLTQLADTLQELKEEGHRCLIFSQFVQHLQIIREMLEEESISYEYLDGQTPAAARQERVDRFQQGEATAFLISLKAGGTGLNLTAADYVIHMDPWWNPAVEDQATDRAHRMGQDKPVMVYRMVAQNTIEEEILRLHDSKRDLVAGVMEGTHKAGKLSTEDLMKLIRG